MTGGIGFIALTTGFGCGETVANVATVPPLFAGSTGEFCFAAPPTTAGGFFGPPICAQAGSERPRTNAPSAVAIVAALALFVTTRAFGQT
jgi:hypothetical protein